MHSRKNIKKNTKIANELARLRRLASDANLQSIIDVDNCIQLFAENNQISVIQLKNLFKRCNFEVEQSDFSNLRSNKIDFIDFIGLVKQVSEAQSKRQETNQILNAFVALGGNSDKSGRVQKSILVNIIRNQFELTFGIEDFLDKTSQGTSLDYDTFAQIFAQTIEDSKNNTSRINSSLSLKLITVPTAQIGQQGATTRIFYNQFQNWLQDSKK